MKTCAFFDVLGQVFRNLRGKVVDRKKEQGCTNISKEESGKDLEQMHKEPAEEGGTVRGPGRGGHRTASCGTQLFGLCGI